MKAFLIFVLVYTNLTTYTYAIPNHVSTTKKDTCNIPSLITPNDDGQNDELHIPCLPANRADNKSELYIFNEWGDRVAFYKPYTNDWTGTYRGEALPDGTYFYIFKFTPSTVTQRGYITIFR
jgi:gliding motility-associated-like protein